MSNNDSPMRNHDTNFYIYVGADMRSIDKILITVGCLGEDEEGTISEKISEDYPTFSIYGTYYHSKFVLSEDGVKNILSSMNQICVKNKLEPMEISTGEKRYYYVIDDKRRRVIPKTLINLMRFLEGVRDDDSDEMTCCSFRANMLYHTIPSLTNRMNDGVRKEKKVNEKRRMTNEDKMRIISKYMENLSAMDEE